MCPSDRWLVVRYANFGTFAKPLQGWEVVGKFDSFEDARACARQAEAERGADGSVRIYHLRPPHGAASLIIEEEEP